MIKIKTHIDHLFDFIEKNSPVKESKIPKNLKSVHTFENFINLLEKNGMIEVKAPLFSADRIFVFKSSERNLNHTPWELRPLSF